MYIIACHKCGKIEVISSLADKYGTTQACWTCPKCGAGQLLEINSNGAKYGGDLHKVIRGMGFATNGRITEKRAHKTPWLEN